jgi:hypothetical protein
MMEAREVAASAAPDDAALSSYWHFCRSTSTLRCGNPLSQQA